VKIVQSTSELWPETIFYIQCGIRHPYWETIREQSNGRYCFDNVSFLLKDSRNTLSMTELIIQAHNCQ